MRLPFEWQKLQVPLGLVAAVIFAAAAGWIYLEGHYVQAADFKAYQYRMDERLLLTQKQRLEDEIFRLEIKRETKPRDFDAVDRAVLERQKRQLEDVKKEELHIRQMRQSQ